MPSYFIVSILALPFIGFYLLSNGAYAISVGETGYNNGVEVPYLVFFFSFLLAFLIFKKKAVDLKKAIKLFPLHRKNLLVSSFLVLLINLSILLSFFFIWGGYTMFVSDIGRGEFRSSLSSGVLYYWCMKIIAPGVVLYYTFVYLRTAPILFDRILFKFNLFVLILIGVSTGFKSTFITLLLPILFLYFWSSTAKEFIKFSLLTMVVLLFVYSLVFKSSDANLMIELMVNRIFVAQADVSWYLWGLYSNGDTFPSYFQSLQSIFGSKIVWLLTGVDKSNINEWIYYDYNSLINILAGLPIRVIGEGHNIVGTIFSESLIAFGHWGILIFPVLSGWFVAFILNFIQSNVLKGRFIIATLALTYFSIFIISWIVGGGVSNIFHISIIVGFAVLFIMLSVLNNLSRRVRVSYA
jgi:hypothetical protein